MKVTALDAMGTMTFIVMYGVFLLVIAAVVIGCIVLAVRAIIRAIKRHELENSEEERHEDHSA